MADGLFALLEDEERFCEFVREKYSRAPQEITAIMHCEHKLADERIHYAYNEYTQSIRRFSVYLHSENPDHYKRAGALLYALNAGEIVTDVALESSAEDLEAGYTRVTAGDAGHVLPFVKFYEAYYNQALAFHVAYRACCAYEATPRAIDLDYYHNVCRYLKHETNLSLDSCFMLFKSLMQ